MLLQGNLPLEFKEGGTLLGRFWRGIQNWEDCFWLEDLKKKEEKKKGKRRIFHFGNRFSFRERRIYTWERKEKKSFFLRGEILSGAARIGGFFCGEAQQSRKKRRLQPSLCQVRFLFFWSFYLLLFWYSRLHSTLDSLAVFFWEVILADWSRHWGPLYLRCWIEICLQACSVMIVFLISLIFFLYKWLK